MKNPDAWYAEQANIAKRFQDNPTAQISPEPAPTPWTGPAGPVGSPGAHGAPPASQTLDQTDDETGYDQSFQHHLGGYNAAINA
jgi:hypothetical protein